MTLADSTQFLTRLRSLLPEASRSSLYECIQDLVENTLIPERFPDNTSLPNRQDITQFLAAWCLHAGLSQDDTQNWLIDYSLQRLANLSKSGPSAIRHSAKSNVKYIYNSNIPFACDLEENPFKAKCSPQCPAYSQMQALRQKRLEEKENPQNFIPVRPAPVPVVSLKYHETDEFKATEKLIREEMAAGTKPRHLIKLLNDKGLKTKREKSWTTDSFCRYWAKAQKNSPPPSA